MVLRAPGGSVDLNRHALRVGSRINQVERDVQARVGEQPCALAQDHRDDQQSDLVDELLLEQPSDQGSAAMDLQLTSWLGLQFADGRYEVAPSLAIRQLGDRRDEGVPKWLSPARRLVNLAGGGALCRCAMWEAWRSAVLRCPGPLRGVGTSCVGCAATCRGPVLLRRQSSCGEASHSRQPCIRRVRGGVCSSGPRRRPCGSAVPSRGFPAGRRCRWGIGFPGHGPGAVLSAT